MKKHYISLLITLFITPSISSMESGLFFQEKSTEGEEIIYDADAMPDKDSKAEDQPTKKQKTEHTRDGICDDCKELNLCCMPEEIKLHIAQFMDCQPFINYVMRDTDKKKFIIERPNHVHHDTKKIAFTITPSTYQKTTPQGTIPATWYTTFAQYPSQPINQGYIKFYKENPDFETTRHVEISSNTGCPCSNPVAQCEAISKGIEHQFVLYAKTDTECWIHGVYNSGEPKHIYSAPSKITALSLHLGKYAIGLQSGQIILVTGQNSNTAITLPAPADSSSVKKIQLITLKNKLLLTAQHVNCHTYLWDITTDPKLLGILKVTNSLYLCALPIISTWHKSIGVNEQSYRVITIDSSRGYNEIIEWDLETLQTTSHILRDDNSPIYSIAVYAQFILALGYENDIVLKKNYNEKFRRMGSINVPHNYNVCFWQSMEIIPEISSRPVPTLRLITHTPDPVTLSPYGIMDLARIFSHEPSPYTIDQKIYLKALIAKIITNTINPLETPADSTDKQPLLRVILHGNESKILWNRVPKFARKKLEQLGYIIKTKKNELQ